ncbi:MAG: AAA family ATPase [Alphaproteobacteria bacterium]|nr:AAA family ATPase [Alphaproteobacteria bacterium]MBP9777299.1 AAA family ATPase [Alphaproteobacteria bacterium]
MAIYHFNTKLLSRSSRNTVRSIAYRAGCELYDSQTGQTFNYEDKAVQHVELVLPKDAPEWAVEIQKLIAEDRTKGVQTFVDIAESAEKRCDARVWREFEFSLHRELTEEQNKALAREFVQDQLCGRGMAAQLNFHFDVDKLTGEEKPHCHVTATTRHLVEEGLSSQKEVEWDKKSLLFELREQWANYSNFHLKLNGHDIQIDHRSNKERGIEMEPQPKRGRGIVEQEKRIQKIEGGDELSFVTDKAKAFYDGQLRNLYRILKNPEIVFDIVTKHHGTFMWADVQKKLHQYVDDIHLFNRIDAKLKNSNELISLRYDPENNNLTIYTTRRMLATEKSLVETADGLGKVKSHGVEAYHIENAITKANEELKKYGGLSLDQKNAIHHLVDEGQIKCVVGIAGAGKTTALEVCHEIWKAEGYAVYGLAPTGKASQNLESKTLGGSSLEQSGIPSTTLHKFLKSYEEGRCQYNEKSVLVLDEAGMVDMGRFEKLLGAVKELGVKLIVVGDGAQLQPVEAGPAFRLVTTRLGKAELNTVIRQKEEWQKEATVLFGQQKTEEAIKAYAEKGYVHIIEEKLPSSKTPEDFVKLYEISHRVSSLIYREMAKEVQVETLQSSNLYPFIKNHQDFGQYLHWKGIERKAAQSILKNAEECRPVLERRCLDPLKLALQLVDKNQSKNIQREEAKGLLKECKLDHLIGIQRPVGAGVDVREQAKEELIQNWHTAFKASPEKSSLMLAYSNRDVNDLNQSARSLLKASGQISQTEFTYTTKKEVEDDFGKTHVLKKQKSFSKGDRIVFTKNKYWQGIRNGTMGTIIKLNNQKIIVKLDEGKEISGKELSFAPNLNPHFDHGWAITIHKSQGTTVDHTFVLASFEMSQNLAYVAMTRHRDWVKVFGSSLDFWRPEKLPQVLSKSGEKLSAGDYLDAESLSQLMKKDDLLITKIFQRMSNELEAMGTVTKQAFWNVADHFLGIHQEKEIRILPESIREEVRAEQLFHQKKDQERVSHLHEDNFHLDLNPSSQEEDNQRKQDLFIQKDPQQQMIEIPLPSHQRLEEKPSKQTFWQTIKASFKGERIKGESSQVSSASAVLSETNAPSFSHTPPALGKKTSPQPKNGKEHYMTAEFKKEILGEVFYQKTTTKNTSHKAPQMISEELKREMLGDKFYNRSYKKAQTSSTREIEKLSRMHAFSHSEEDQAHHEQDISLSQKPPSRGRRR